MSCFQIKIAQTANYTQHLETYINLWQLWHARLPAQPENWKKTRRNMQGQSKRNREKWFWTAIQWSLSRFAAALQTMELTPKFERTDWVWTGCWTSALNKRTKSTALQWGRVRCPASHVYPSSLLAFHLHVSVRLRRAVATSSCRHKAEGELALFHHLQIATILALLKYTSRADVSCDGSSGTIIQFSTKGSKLGEKPTGHMITLSYA